MAKDRVSVVMANFKKPLWQVRRAILSAINQSSDRMGEIILYDDASGTHYQAKLAQLSEQIGACRLRVMYGSTNAGVAAARNNAITATEDGLIVLLDTDDELHPEAVEALCRRMREGIDVVFSDHLVVHSNGTSWIRRKLGYHSMHVKHWATQYDPLIQSTYVVSCQMLRVKTFWDVGGYPSGVTVGESAWLLPRIGYRRGYVCMDHVPAPLYKHYWSTTGLYITRREEQRASVSAAFLEAAQRLQLGVSKVEFLARLGPYKVGHYQLFDQTLTPILCPYIDYPNKLFRGEQDSYLQGHENV